MILNYYFEDVKHPLVSFETNFNLDIKCWGFEPLTDQAASEELLYTPKCSLNLGVLKDINIYISI